MGPIGPVIAVVIQGMALFSFLFAFRFAGQTVGKIHEVISGRGNQLKEAIKGNAQDPNSLRNKAKANLGHTIARSQANIMAEGKKSKTGPMPSRFKRFRAGLVGGGAFGNVEGRLAHYQELANKNKDALTANSLDDLLYAAGGYEKNGHYYNSKGDEIAAWEYKRGKSLYGQNMNAIGSALGYRLYKSQDDKDIGQLRESFRQNAINNQWSDEDATRVWAAATYPYKAQMGSEWYSAPVLQRNAQKQVTGVDFQDIGQEANEGKFGEFSEELHKTRSSFRLSDIRDGDWRAMAAHQDRVQTKLSAGIMPSQEELNNYAKTSEIMDTVTQQMRGSGMLTVSEGGDVSVAGVSAAGQSAIKAMMSDSNRRFGVTHAIDSSGKRSVNERIIYDRAPILAHPSTKPPLTAGQIDTLQQGNVVGKAVVTGDINRTAANV